MDSNNLHNDKELFLLIAEGDEQAFSQLFGLYAHRLYPFLYRIVKSQWEAEEFIQETMLRVWLHRDKLHEIEHPQAWIYRIATNLALSFLEKELLQRKVTADIQATIQTERAGVEESLSFKKLQESIRSAIEQLPPQRRLIFELSREKGMTRAKIAQQFNISEKTVKNTINAALRSIREYLQRAGHLLFLLYCLLLEK